jgi:dihydrolipoamide dehydrogenase
VGCEFATMFSRLGSKVTVVEALDRLLPLPSVDQDCSRVLQREMKKRKISFLLGKTVVSCQCSEDGVQAVVAPADGLAGSGPEQQETLRAEAMLVSIGRAPNTRDMGLENTDVELDDKGWVLADEAMQTRDKRIYAVGDVCGPSRIMLAHVATAEALVASENALGGERTMSYDTVPGCIFTSPEVANVGLTEAQAMEKGLDFRAESVLFRTMGKAQATGEIAGQAKMIADRSSGRLLGVHIVGPHATELIGEATLALQTGCTVQALADTIHAHPTLSEIMVEVAAKASGRPLHG